jgi:hypothetical protein
MLVVLSLAFFRTYVEEMGTDPTANTFLYKDTHARAILWDDLESLQGVLVKTSCLRVINY